MTGRESPLDHPMNITIFNSVMDNRSPARGPLRRDHVSLRDLESWVRENAGGSKADLPLLKLGVFGNQKNAKGWYRHDENLRAIFGVECDYDGEQLSLEAAARLLRKAGVACLLYTTPSHTPEKPRWRVLAPCSNGCDPSERARYVARINGALGGVLKGESFALSQIFYFGGIEGQPAPQTVLVDGAFIDDLCSLDVGAIGKGAVPEVGNEQDESRSGRHWRAALKAARAGLSYEEHLEQLDSELAEYASEARGKSTKGEHDWQRALDRAHKEQVELADKLPSYVEEDQQFAGYMTADEMSEQPRPFDIVEGLLYEEQVSVWYGMPKTAKSFLTLDLCCHVANGSAWGGRAVEKRNVLVLPLEGRGTLIDRVRAWEAHNKAKCPVIFRLKPFDLNDKDHVADVIAYVRANNIGLVVIDTLARATPGTDEDRAKDMGVIVTRLDRIKDAGAHVMIVHHSNKGGSMRGSIAVAGAADLIVKLTRTGEQRMAIIEENRHGKDGEVLRFTLEARKLDITDTRGKTIVSAAVNLEGEWFEGLSAQHDAARSTITDSEEDALAILRKRARLERYLGPMTRDEARSLLKDKSWGPKSSGAWRTAFSRLMASLERKGLLKFDLDDGVTLTA